VSQIALKVIIFVLTGSGQYCPKHLKRIAGRVGYRYKTKYWHPIGALFDTWTEAVVVYSN